MIRDHWRDPRFWRWFWQNRAPFGVKVVGGVLGAALFLLGGFVAADSLSGANAGVSAATYQTTIQKQVTVREHGKTIVKRVPVVRRVFLQPQTEYETRFQTRVVTTPGGVRVVRQQVVKYVPVVRRQVVTVNGKTRTVTKTRRVPVTTIRTQTLTNVVTNQQTVVNQETVTVVNNRTVTTPVTVTQNHTETKLVTLPVQTVTQTLPVQTVTVTLPVVTITLP